MPETPDFDQLAEQMAAQFYVTVDRVTLPIENPGVLMTREWYVEQLRLAWNARGAADLATIEAALAIKPPDILDQLRALDR